MFAQAIFPFPVMNNSIHHLFVWYFNHFTTLLIFEGYIIYFSNLKFKNIFVISEWGERYVPS